MKITPLILCLLSSIVYGPVHGEETDMSRAIELGLFADTPTQAERLVLVLHAGRTGGHLQSGARVNMYRPRGTYANATWNRKVARRIAKRHGVDLSGRLVDE